MWFNATQHTLDTYKHMLVAAVKSSQFS